MKELAMAGDLLFYRVNPSSLKERIIGALSLITGEGSGAYCHVGMLSENLTDQYEAVPPRIRKSCVDWSNPHLELWRIKDAEAIQLKDMLRAAASDVGWRYGIGESLLYLFKRKRLTVCTQYVIDSAAAGYINLAEDKGDKLVFPDELSTYKAIYKIS